MVNIDHSMHALSSGMLVWRLSFPIFFVLALLFGQGRAVCSAIIGNNNDLVSESATLACASQFQPARVWDVPLPTLHEKIYGRQDEWQPQDKRSGSIAPPPFAYITASSWPRWGTKDTGCDRSTSFGCSHFAHDLFHDLFNLRFSAGTTERDSCTHGPRLRTTMHPRQTSATLK